MNFDQNSDDENKMNEGIEVQNTIHTDELHNLKFVSGMYKNWFLDYASYVILERAVPHVFDGLKPVHRRILHSMKRLDDGRYNKVANIIGYTMQYHPHGDASIGDALVQLGQKDLLIDAQGNWGNILTGDNAAAARYIEARLSKFALEVVFNPKTTHWKLSYDGRNKEPINLPVKFPLLLAQGVEGIAVGLASKILPHNFNELIDACIAHLKHEKFVLYPDFQTGGMIDVCRYNDGLRGGKVRVRAKISKLDKKTLVITEIPFSQTTSGVIESIISANEKGKIKIRKIDDNTAAQVEIMVHLIPGTSPDVTMDALYAFTDCEISISPNACVIDKDKPRFIGVSEILRISAQGTLELLKSELQIRKSELIDSWHQSSLEKIFIENRIYNHIEDCETWESIIETIDKGLTPFKASLMREVTVEDIEKLTEIKIKRISKFDAFKADEYLRSIEKEIKEIDHHLAHIVEYTINYYQNIKNKFGKGRERKTEIRNFDTIEAAQVVIANEKLYINWAEGFAGTALKKDTYICDCSDLDDIIIFRRDGSYIITKVADKLFIGQNAIHVGLFRKNDERTIYNVIYRDGTTGNAFMKRFPVKGVTRDKEYDLTQATPMSQVLYFSANPNGEAETIRVTLKPRPRLKKPAWEVDFSSIGIKNRSSVGNLLTKYPVHKIIMKEKGESTLGGRKLWFDTDVFRLNTDGKGVFVGEFFGTEKILVILKSGQFYFSTNDLSNHFDNDVLLIEKHNAAKIFTALFYNADEKAYCAKRFQIEYTEKQVSFIGDNSNSRLIHLSDDKYPRVEIKFGGKQKKRANEIINIHEFITVKGYKALGKKISIYEIERFEFIEPIILDEPELEEIDMFDEHSEETSTEPEFEIVRPDGEKTIFDQLDKKK